MKKTPAYAISILMSSRSFILNRLNSVVGRGSFNYRTFGVDVENHLSNIIIDIFKRRGLVKTKSDYNLAPDKNSFPDFILRRTSPPLAIEYKSGNRSRSKGGKWVECRNSNNDMGTMNTWPKKIKKFGGENIYYIFVIYRFDSKAKKITDIQIAPFYHFLGLSRNGILKYREKDGNLRPKDFDEKPRIKSLKQFNALLNKAICYRSKRIIKKHRTILRSFCKK